MFIIVSQPTQGYTYYKLHVCLEGEISVDFFALANLSSRMFIIMLVAK